jgi:hypothetical protein
MTAQVALLLGAGVGMGALLIIVGLSTEPAEVKGPSRVQALLRLLGMTQGGRLYQDRRLILGCIVVGFVIGVFTGWYVGAILLPFAAATMPGLLRAPVQSQEAGKVADLTAWVRALSGNLAGGSAGLESAIRNTFRAAPKSLRPTLAVLIARLDAMQPLRVVLRAWADEVGDFQGDLVAAVLILEADERSGGLSDALDGLARSLADQAKAMQEIENERAEVRTNIRLVTIIAAGSLTLFALSGWMAPYATPAGQVVFLVLFCAFVGLLLLMRKVGQGKPIERFLPAPKEA